MALVFVSYSRQDEAFVSKLIGGLEAQGVPIWRDTTDIEPGGRWDFTIEEALDTATHILVVLSQASVTSTTVRDEINWALDEEKRVIPIMATHCTRPLRIRSIQYIDFTENQDRAFEELLRQLPRERPDGQVIADIDIVVEEDDGLNSEGVFGHEFAYLPEDKKPIQEGGEYLCPTLVLMSTDKTNKRHWVMKINSVQIGRDPHCEIIVPTAKISRNQAIIRRVGEEFEIVDTGSTNGTWVNGQKLTPGEAVKLNHGDLLTFSRIFFILFQYFTPNIFKNFDSEVYTLRTNGESDD